MKTSDKIDLYKLHKDEYVAPRKPVFVNIKEATYLAASGQGEPGGSAFTDKIGALYGVAFTIKMARKFSGGQDYAIAKLEAQWWCGDRPGDFTLVPKDQWCWKLLIRTPGFVAQDELTKAVEVLRKRGKTQPVHEVRLELLAEGECVQMLHLGPYEREADTIAVMKTHAEKNGFHFQGRHHEIYLSDPRRVSPERLKTILRHPVTRT